MFFCCVALVGKSGLVCCCIPVVGITGSGCCRLVVLSPLTSGVPVAGRSEGKEGEEGAIGSLIISKLSSLKLESLVDAQNLHVNIICSLFALRLSYIILVFPLMHFGCEMLLQDLQDMSRERTPF